MSKKRKKTIKKRAKRPGPVARYDCEIPRVRVTQEDYDLICDAAERRAGRARGFGDRARFIRDTLHEAAVRELGRDK